MAIKKTTRKKAAPRPSLIRTHSLTAGDLKILQRFSQDASDLLGWTVSGSAIVRALLRYADEQGEVWTRKQLYPLIEDEIAQGTVWGHRSEKK
jgi:hypothetical protein